jgi:hypothetical protein
LTHSWDVTGLLYAYPLAKYGDIWWFYNEVSGRLFSMNVPANAIIDEKLGVYNLYKTNLDDSRFFIEFYDNNLLYGGELSPDGTFNPAYLDKLPMTFYTDSTLSPTNVIINKHEHTIDIIINDTTYQHIELVKRFGEVIVDRLYENDDYYILSLTFYNYDVQTFDEIIVYCNKVNCTYHYANDNVDSTYGHLCYSIDNIHNYHQLLYKAFNASIAEPQQETLIYWFDPNPKFIVYYDREMDQLRYIDARNHLLFESDAVDIYDGLIFYENFEDVDLEHEYIFWNSLHPTVRWHNGLPIVLFDFNRQKTRSGKVVGYNVPQLWDATSFKTSIVFPEFVKRVSLDFDVFWLSTWNYDLWDNTIVFSDDVYDSIDYTVDGYFPYIVYTLSQSQDRNLYNFNDVFIDLDLTFVDYSNSFSKETFLSHPALNPFSSAYINSETAFVDSCKNGSVT